MGESMNQTQVPNPDPIEQAVNTIRSLQAEVAVMGANDSEHGDLEELLAQVKEGKITPTQAIERAYRIRDRKNEYH